MRSLVRTLAILAILLTGCGAQPAPPPTALPTAAPPIAAPAPQAAAQPLEQAPTAEPEPRSEKSLTVCLAQEPETLNPLDARGSAAEQILAAVVEPGVEYLPQPTPVILSRLPTVENGDVGFEDVTVQPGDPVYDPVAGKVVQWEGAATTKPRMAVTFRMQPGIVWQDGAPLTAQDAYFAASLDRLRGNPRWWDGRTGSFEAPDDATLRWIGVPGYVNLGGEYLTAFPTPMPKHLLEGLSPDAIASSDYARRPLGYGPFAVDEWAPGDHLRLVRNPSYRLADAGLPHLDAVVFRFAHGEEEMMALLELGRCDVVPPGSLSMADVARLRELEAAGELELLVAPSSFYEQLTFGMARPDRPPGPLADRRVRQAIAYGADRLGMVDRVMGGLAPIAEDYLPPEAPLWRGDSDDLQPVMEEWGVSEAGMPEYPYDPDRAAGLLREAGWEDTDGDGIREDRSGNELRIGYACPLSPSWRQAVAERFAEEMRQIGIGVDLQLVPAEFFFGSGAEPGVLGHRAFDVSEFSWDAGLATPACERYHSANIPAEANGWKGFNYAGYDSAEFDGACETALNARTPEEFFGGHATALIRFEGDVPALPLFRRVDIGAVRAGVSGLGPPTTSPRWALHHLAKLDVAAPGAALAGPAPEPTSEAPAPGEVAAVATATPGQPPDTGWVVIILDRFKVNPTDDTVDEAIVLSQVTAGKRTIKRRWPDRMWREASSNKKPITLAVTVDTPIFWIRVEDLKKSEWLEMNVTVVDDEQTPGWLSDALSAGSFLLGVLQDVKKAPVPWAKDDIFPLERDLFKQISDKLNGSDLEGVLIKRHKVSALLDDLRNQEDKTRSYTDVAAWTKDRNKKSVKISYSVYLVPDENPTRCPTLSVDQIRFKDGGDGNSGDIYLRAAVAARDPSAEDPNLHQVEVPEVIGDHDDVDENDAWPTAKVPIPKYSLKSKGDAFPFVYFELGIWDHDSMSRDDLVGLYSKTLRWWKWEEDARDFNRAHEVAGIDEGEAVITTTVTLADCP